MYQVFAALNAAAWGGAPLPSPRGRVSGRRHCVFIHEIDSCTSCPGTNRHVHLLAHFGLVSLQIGDGDRVHLDESAPVERFDLKDWAERDDFAGFFVGSAAEGGGSAEESLEDEHGDSLSDGWLVSSPCSMAAMTSIMAFPVRSAAVSAVCCAATY
jgi:hypothetical protein